MKDLTTGSVTRHLMHMSAFLAMSMVVQTLYLLGGTSGEGGNRGGRCGGQHHDDCAGAYPNAGRGHNYIDRTGGWKKRSGARRVGVQSVFRHVDRDCVRSRDCRIPGAERAAQYRACSLADFWNRPVA